MSLSFEETLRLIMEGKFPAEDKGDDKKPKKGDKKEDAESVLAKVKKDLGVKPDDGDPDGDDKENDPVADSKDDDKDGVPDGVQKDGDDADVSGHPDDPASTGKTPPAPGAQEKKPAKLDKSKDPFKEKGASPVKDDGADDGAEEKPATDSTDAEDPPDDSKPKDGKKPKSKGKPGDDGDAPEKDGEADDSGGEPGGDKPAGDDDSNGEKSDGTNDKDDPIADDGEAKGGKTDDEDGESEEEVVDGSTTSKINLKPKIEDQEIATNESRAPLKKYRSFKKLDEISRAKIGNYVRASAKDIDDNSYSAGMDHDAPRGSDEDRHHVGSEAKIARRHRGINRAVRRLTELTERIETLDEDHHARMYRYHDQQARRIDQHLNSGKNWNSDPDFTGESERGLRTRKAYHVARCKHHENAMSPGSRD